ncbi:MAG: hypothetical protein E7429_03390 [Ruminococcaceae bacterium]|nr:hypothetical protein [Oscillospiraceae bacterium]
MAKNTNKKAKPSSWDAPMTGAMKFFLAGGVAELYMLIIRNNYVEGSIMQRIHWYQTYLPILAGIGGGVLLLGAILTLLWRQDKKKRTTGLVVLGAGAAFALLSLIGIWNYDMVVPVTLLIPGVMVLGILWNLYDRECALALTILGVTLAALLVCRQRMDHLTYGTLLKVAVAVYIVVLAAVALLAKTGKLHRLIPARADLNPVYLACGLSVIALATLFFSATVAYYAMWVLAAVVFALVVYYTVKQL